MKVFEDIARKLDLINRMREEVQIMAHSFDIVDLEGLKPFDNELPIFTNEIEKSIQENWKIKTEKYPGIFPGALASVEDFQVEGSLLKFQLKLSRFDIYDGVKQYLPLKLETSHRPLDNNFCLPLSMGAVTITAPDENYPNGAIVFGIRRRTTAFSGNSTTLPAGYFNPETDSLRIGDPGYTKILRSIMLTTLKELKEEMNISDYKQFEYLGLVYDGVIAKGLLLAVRLTLAQTKAQIESVLKDMGAEVERYHFVANDIESVKEFIKTYAPTPHDVGKVVLHFSTI